MTDTYTHALDPGTPADKIVGAAPAPVAVPAKASKKTVTAPVAPATDQGAPTPPEG